MDSRRVIGHDVECVLRRICAKQAELRRRGANLSYMPKYSQSVAV